MSSYKVEICGVNTSSLPLLTSKEKSELLDKIKQGDQLARDQFIQGNLRLVLSIAHRFARSGEELDDLFQIGCIGLIKAIDNFNTELGVQFSTYAVPMIIGELKRHMRDGSNPIRVSRSLRDTAYKALRARETLMTASQREPAMCEIADEIGIPQEDIVMALEAIQTPVSIYEPLYTDGNDSVCLGDQIKDKHDQENCVVNHIALDEAISRLSERERQIIHMRYFDCKTQMETASEIGISQAQVSRLEKCALKTMRQDLE